MEILDGKKIRDQMLEALREEVLRLPRTPLFCDIVVGDDPASLQYVRMKNAVAARIGVGIVPAQFPSSATTDEVIAKIRELNAHPDLAGLIVQLPLPPHIDKQAVLDAIDPLVDVDATGAENTALFYGDTPRYLFPTAAAVMALLETCGRPHPEDHAVIIGRGELVGRPVAHLLSRICATTIVDRKTAHPETVLRTADIAVSAAGEGGLVTGDMLQKGVILIDAGTSESYGSIVGDVNTESVSGIAGMLAPVPGGVGPVTVAMLFKNLLLAAKEKFRIYA